MFEFIGMIALCLLLWFFLIGPAIFGAMFGLNKFTDAIKVNLVINGFIVFLVVITFAIAMCINFLSGDTQPITTFLERFE